MNIALRFTGDLLGGEKLSLWLSKFSPVALIPDTQGQEAIQPAGIPAHKDDHTNIGIVDLQLSDGSARDFPQQLSANPKLKGLLILFGERGNTLFELSHVTDGQDVDETIITQMSLCIIEGPDDVDHDLVATDPSEGAGGPQATHHKFGDILTPRELDLLKLFSRGLSYREAANALVLSQHTVGDYVKSIYRKLRVHSRTEAIYEARQSGLISPLD